MAKTPAEALVQMKRRFHDYDVFMCYDHADKHAVKKVAVALQLRGVLPWLDEWELRPGFPWQPELEKQIKRIKSAAVFVGQSGISPWQNVEIDAFLREFMRRRCAIIPVILPDCKHVPDLPVFLSGLQWVDFRQYDPNPLKMLVWGITGRLSTD